MNNDTIVLLILLPKLSARFACEGVKGFHLDRRLYNVVDFRKRKLYRLVSALLFIIFAIFTLGKRVPVLVALPICKNDIGILAHHLTRSVIHQLECTFVIRLRKSMRLRKSIHPQRHQSCATFAARITSYRWNPCPSILTTRNVFGSNLSANSKFFTYAYFEPAILERPSPRPIQINKSFGCLHPGFLH